MPLHSISWDCDYVGRVPIICLCGVIHDHENAAHLTKKLRSRVQISSNFIDNVLSCSPGEFQLVDGLVQLHRAKTTRCLYWDDPQDIRTYQVNGPAQPILCLR